MAQIPVFLGGSSSGVGTNATGYFSFGDTGLGTGTPTATESNTAITWRTAGVFTLLRINVVTNSATISATTFKLRKNSANPASGLSLSIAAGTTGEFVDNTDSVSISAGDTVDYQEINADLVGSLNFWNVSVIFSANSNTVKKFNAGNAGVAVAANVTTYFPCVGCFR